VSRPKDGVHVGVYLDPDVHAVFKLACNKLRTSIRAVFKRCVYETIQRSREVEIDYDSLLATLYEAEEEAGLR